MTLWTLRVQRRSHSWPRFAGYHAAFRHVSRQLCNYITDTELGYNKKLDSSDVSSICYANHSKFNPCISIMHRSCEFGEYPLHIFQDIVLTVFREARTEDRTLGLQGLYLDGNSAITLQTQN